MTRLSVSDEQSARFPDLAKACEEARATLAEAEAHYGYMRTMRAEDDYIAASRAGDRYALDLADRISEARAQYRADCAEARTGYKAALQAKTDAHIAVLTAESEAQAADMAA